MATTGWLLDLYALAGELYGSDWYGSLRSRDSAARRVWHEQQSFAGTTAQSPPDSRWGRSSYPRTVAAGRLESLFALGGALDAGMHLHPLSATPVHMPAHQEIAAGVAGDLEPPFGGALRGALRRNLYTYARACALLHPRRGSWRSGRVAGWYST